jgi:hypothetical protein
MPALETARHRLPLLAVTQAQKEITHNEALILVDALLHPVAEAELSVPPIPSEADIGKCWLIGPAPTGVWQGKAAQIAIWISGGWRYFSPAVGMRLRLLSEAADKIWSGNGWSDAPAIPDPSGGNIIDVEARAAITLLLQYFRLIGLVTP